MGAENIKAYIKENDHKKIILIGLLGVTTLLFLMFGVWAYVLGVMPVFYIKLILFVLLGILFVSYLRSDKTAHYASLFLIILEIEGFLEIFSAVHYDFMVIYPFSQYPVFSFSVH